MGEVTVRDIIRGHDCDHTVCDLLGIDLDWPFHDFQNWIEVTRRAITGDTEHQHVIQFRDDGWIIAHPLEERLDGTLFDCSAHWDADDPGERGRFVLNDDGTIGARVDG